LTSASSHASAAHALHCFASPGRCNYPDRHFDWHTARAWAAGGGGVGPTNGRTATPCSALPASGSVTTSSDGQVIENLHIFGSIIVNRPNVTIKDVCVTTDGHGVGGSGAFIVHVAGGATGLTIENSTLQSVNNTTGATDLGVQNHSGGVVTLKHDYVHGCGVCLVSGAWNVQDSYLLTDAVFQSGPAEHTEDVYFDYDIPSPGAVFTHDTMLNDHGETAVIFWDDTNGAECSGALTLKHSLIAGGGYTIYTCGGNKSTHVGTSTVHVENNNWARCTTPPITHHDEAGGNACQGATTFHPGSGADSHGYWPYGGYYGTETVAFCGANEHQIWTGNVWDDNGTNVPC
jgi:hypothetical protein